VRDPSAPDRFLYFSVTDTGVGIDPEAQKRLFMPFSQADSTISRRFGGTGLGLNLCKRFVELMGGTIGVTSRLGEGSQFWFTLPLVIPEEGADSGGNELESAEPRVLRRPLRILLVEDYDVNRAIVRTYLKEMPYTVDEAENGEVGVAKMKAGRYDLVLMDIHMPVMDGYTATRTIRAWEQERGLKRTPIVALTAHAYDEDIRASTNAGCDHHLTKPFTKKALLEAIFDAVGDEQGEVSIQEEIDPDIRALIPFFLADLVKMAHEADEAAANGNWEALKGIGHKIKGAGGSFGFDRISQLGGALENAAQAGDRNTAVPLLSELADFIQRMDQHGN
jgi:CheY-like chemotaxis protein/HPt (histidine-containing phosphotransfer) domain-containing protein